MTVWRVYRPYHESSESGTIEFGYYSTEERAKQRALEAWRENDYGDISEVDQSGSIHAQSGWGDSISIYVSEIEVDHDSNHNVCGYT